MTFIWIKKWRRVIIMTDNFPVIVRNETTETSTMKSVFFWYRFQMHVFFLSLD